jgi:hypothetical protein
LAGKGGFKNDSFESSTTSFATFEGMNARSAATPENMYLLKRHLTSNDAPTFLLMNECGTLGNKYKDIKTHSLITNGDRVAIIYDNKYKVNRILSEMNDDHNLICNVGTKNKSKSVILYSVYLAPGNDHKDLLKRFLYNIKVLKDRYDNPSIMVYGDFNLDREKFKSKIEDVLKPYGFKCHYDKEPNKFTRFEKVKGEDKTRTSYLDYFITFNVDTESFTICEEILKSDHLPLRAKIKEVKGSEKLFLKKERKINFSTPMKDSQMIGNILSNIFTGDLDIRERCNSVNNLISHLKVKYKPRVRKARNYFKLKPRIEKYIKGKKEIDEFDYGELRKMVRHSNNEEYKLFMEQFEECDKNSKYSEYFKRLRFYSEIDKNTDILKDLIITNDDGNEEAITDTDEVDKRVTEFYKKNFKDDGKKSVHPFYKGGLLNLTSEDVDIALHEINLDKACSWDFIPGKAFKNIRDMKKYDLKLYNSACKNIADWLNYMMVFNCFPQDIITYRLFCLNKKGGEPGRLENIRPIAIGSTVLKIIQFSILRHLQKYVYNDKGEFKGIINNKQIGFIKRCGCDLNILKLRTQAKILAASKKPGRKLIAFFDFKDAFGSVPHQKLYEKLYKKNVDPKIINSIIRLYNILMIKTPFGDTININNGTAQGDPLSPILFDIFVDDLIEKLSGICFEVLAYADDLAVMCESEEELMKVVSFIEDWCQINGIKINYKKSGVLYLDNISTDEKEIFGIPIVKEYKYLGVIIDKNINCLKQTRAICSKLNKYRDRNYKLKKIYFSPRSLIQIFNYLQRSRLIYGMSSFVDLQSSMKKLESELMGFIISIFNLEPKTHQAKIRVTLGIPQIVDYLTIQLLNNLRKYEDILGVKIDYFDKFLSDKLDKDVMVKVKNSKSFLGLDIYSIKYNHILNSIKIEGEVELKQNISEFYIFSYSKNGPVFNSYDRKNVLVIKFLCNNGFFRERMYNKCLQCNCNFSREHVVNTCGKFDDARLGLQVKLEKTMGGDISNGVKGLTLHDKILKIFYNPDMIGDVKKRNKVIMLFKEFIYTIYSVDREGFVEWSNEPKEKKDLTSN